MTKLVRPEQQPVQSLLDLALRFGVNARRRLIQNQQRRILQDRSRNGYSLLFTDALPYPALAHSSVQAGRQPRNKLIRVRRAKRLPNLRLGRIGFSEQQIFTDRSVK